MSEHKEVPVKVNAYVDEGIAELIEALSGIPGLVTRESCQGGDGRDAFVIFEMGGWKEVGHFLFDRLLPTMKPDLRADVALQIRAYGEGTAHGEISMNSHAVPLLLECVQDLAKGKDDEP